MFRKLTPPGYNWFKYFHVSHKYIDVRSSTFWYQDTAHKTVQKIDIWSYWRQPSTIFFVWWKLSQLYPNALNIVAITNTFFIGFAFIMETTTNIVVWIHQNLQNSILTLTKNVYLLLQKNNSWYLTIFI